MSLLKEKKKYDLEYRTTEFAGKTIDLLRTLKPDAVNQRLISQLVGSSGSIGANYSEAIEAKSKKDFIHKIYIAKKETKETNHWLKLLLRANPSLEVPLKPIFQECHELLLIFSKIVSTSKLKIVN